VTNAEYGKGLARAAGGALLFSFPLLMTMEMWQLGFSIERWRLLLFLLLSLPMLLGLSYFVGFEPTFRLKDEVLDALAGFGVGFLVVAAILLMFNVLAPGDPLGETVGKVALAAVPAAMGALLAGKQFGGGDRATTEERKARYPGRLFIMLAGALFLAFNVAPTEEMSLIAFKMTPLHALGLVVLSMALLHLFVYRLGFPGEDLRRGASGPLRIFLTYSAVGYAVALLISAYSLWTFGRLDGAGLYQQVMMTVVLAFPAALGAATARLVV
jgi:putative integral membrane protein (TIGR02587 family)